jgi:hypothetical protein
VPIPGHAWYTRPSGTIGVLSTLAAALRTPAYTYQGWAGLVRRLDAVDTDGRLYRITRTPYEQRPGLAVSDDRFPDDPLTRAALTDLLHATRIPQPAHHW